VSKWAGKYVIGLTGNIGTGKSVVRRMLEHLGAYGLDADALSHRAISKGAPGYQPVIDHFGRWILAANGEIDRAKLSRVVFNDPEALATLEGIIHPLVLQGVDWLIRRSTQTVIVIEAIKLLETNLHKTCDAVWVVYTPPELQMARLMQNRKMSEIEARQRIAAQPPQEQKIAAANFVVRNDNSFEETWKQINAAWLKFIPKTSEAVEEVQAQKVQPERSLPQGEISVLRGKPRDSEAIAALINRVRKNARPIGRYEIIAAFGEKAFLMLNVGSSLTGILGWQVENLVARTVDIYLLPEFSTMQVLPALIEEMERSSKNLQCEASLIFAPPEIADETFWHNLGYEKRAAQSLGVSAWQEAAAESMRPDSVLFFKQLRVDRVLRPI
jgi:dephospho-CoA kinase